MVMCQNSPKLQKSHFTLLKLIMVLECCIHFWVTEFKKHEAQFKIIPEKNNKKD